MGTYDARSIRGQFPLLRDHPQLSYLDSAATSQVPDCVLEAGTPNIAGAVGFARACDFLASLDREALQVHTRELCNQVIDLVSSLRGARILGPQEPGSHDALVSLALDGVHPHDLAEALGERGVAVRAGSHCAMPIHQELCVPASLRVSFGAYSIEGDVERLAGALLECREELR